MSQLQCKRSQALETLFTVISAETNVSLVSERCFTNFSRRFLKSACEMGHWGSKNVRATSGLEVSLVISEGSEA